MRFLRIARAHHCWSRRPRGTPRPIIETLEKACEVATQDESLKGHATRQGVPLVYLKSADFAQLARAGKPLALRNVTQYNAADLAHATAGDYARFLIDVRSDRHLTPELAVERSQFM